MHSLAIGTLLPILILAILFLGDNRTEAQHTGDDVRAAIAIRTGTEFRHRHLHHDVDTGQRLYGRRVRIRASAVECVIIYFVYVRNRVEKRATSL